ncbi:mercury transporter MerT [Candidatus Nitrosoglobus terrae]|uniref:Mercuric transport protein MerT n=1 Tax=Candidatus Nitrosoglobus terrae TaxID=1630141 RepID=A0A1Q2SMN2_9GAMM|nr:mercuric transporter MerT family protein [Candidatus Nitrosoglobus terrae]BAW80381.1 mercury transporter MerT [Candidatus Nitrosoglobus terrae]
MTQFTSKGSLVAGTLAAIGASVCCVGPLVLLTLGIGGTWVSHLSAFEPYRPLFIGLTLVFLWFAFRNLYLIPKACALDIPCVNTQVLRYQRLIFWIITTLLLTLLAAPWLAPLLY